jgi:hypothetical protein
MEEEEVMAETMEDQEGLAAAVAEEDPEEEGEVPADLLRQLQD